VVSSHCTVQISQSATLRVIQPVQLSSLLLSPATGAFSFTLTAETGFNYGVESSSNLTNWTRLRTLTNFSGELRFTDPEASNFGQRFYRVTLVNP
jgi:hypothetical protein